MSTLFEATDNATVNISVSTSTQNVLVQNYSGESQIRVFNGASGTVFLRFGGSSVVALAASDIPIASGYTCGFSIGSAASTIYAAVICPSGTGNIYFTPGSGI